MEEWQEQILGSAKRMARFPDDPFRPTEELRKRKGKGKRPRSSGASYDSQSPGASDDSDWAPLFEARTGPKRRRPA